MCEERQQERESEGVVEREKEEWRRIFLTPLPPRVDPPLDVSSPLDGKRDSISPSVALSLSLYPRGGGIEGGGGELKEFRR